MELFRMRLMTRSFLSAIALASVTQAKAAGHDEIVVSATRVERPLSEVGSSVSVIDAAEIAIKQYSFTADALRDAAGVTIARNSSIGGVATARIRGAASRQSLVIIDGVVMNDPAAPQGGFNFANLDLVDIDRIEILRGPQSVLYGPDAIGGVIYITTRRAEESGARAFAEGGSFGFARGGATLFGKAGAADGRVTVSGIRSDGISRAAAGTETDGFRSVAGSLRAGVDFGRDWRLEATARYADASAEVDGFPPPDFTLADSDDTEDTEEFAASGRLMSGGADRRFIQALTLSYNNIARRSLSGGAPGFSADGDRFSAEYFGRIQ
jgi:vitamin B12 transporter